MDEKSIFNTARKIEDEVARSEFLELACGQNTELKNRLVDMLAAYTAEPDFLEPDSIDISATEYFEPEPSRIGEQIGPYKLLQQIGEGGFGTVYMAEQSRPVRRKVALKVIKAGMDSKEIVARFESERQALALMDHPNIAKVLDAGSTKSGRPFFVMELVKGIPLTNFCDENCLSLPERLKLFVMICRAVQHAHHKGVVHRDLKPSNVLVTLHDNKPVIKVIDFGVSKAISQQLTEKTLFTAFGQMVGTPAYMSPEQAQMSGLDVDTRTDVYSLGIILYELMTGVTPIDSKTLREKGYAEIQRIICEEDVPRPSPKLSTCEADATVKVAKSRGVEPRQLGTFLKADLDWIALNALEKDRNRRYDTANSFADDIERFLNNEAVVARPPTLAYRIRKFSARNKVALSTGGIVLLSLIVAIIVTTSQWWRALEAEELAESRYNQEVLARSAETAAKDAELKARKAERSARMLAERERLEAETAKYAMQLKFANLHCSDNNVPLALEQLGHTKPELRRWEYHRVKADCDNRYREFGNEKAYFAVAISPDGTLVAGGGKGSTVEIFQFETAEKLARLVGPWTQVNSLKFSKDGKLLAAASDTCVQVWDISTRKKIGSVEVKSEPGQLPGFCYGKPRPAIAFDSISERLAIGLLNEIQIWDAQLKQIQSKMSLPVGFIQGLDFSPNNQNLAVEGFEKQKKAAESASQDVVTQKLVIVDLASQKFEERVINEKYSSSTSKGAVVYDPNNRWLITVGQSSNNSAIKRIDVNTNAVPDFAKDNRFFTSAPAGFSDAIFSSDGSRLVLADHIKLLVQVMDCQTGQILKTIRLPKFRLNFLNEIDISADGRRIVTAIGTDFLGRGAVGSGQLAGVDINVDERHLDISSQSDGQLYVNGIRINEDQGWVAKAVN